MLSLSVRISCNISQDFKMQEKELFPDEDNIQHVCTLHGRDDNDSLIG